MLTLNLESFRNDQHLLLFFLTLHNLQKSFKSSVESSLFESIDFKTDCIKAKRLDSTKREFREQKILFTAQKAISIFCRNFRNFFHGDVPRPII
jgi:hypothetical protein